ncbi:MAG: zinc ribbon domain-containing protein [Defluviitaleaceae bacterium]|nr:zinc ribbon domain-containing protein [Defluviitaleaceae bacterium]
MIIFGWGHHKTEDCGNIQSTTVCMNCNNTVYRAVVKDTTYFTLFFIPLIPYDTKRLLICPICGVAQVLTADEFESMTGRR